MENLIHQSSLSQAIEHNRPSILHAGKFSVKDLREFKKQNIFLESDVYDIQITELAQITNPARYNNIGDAGGFIKKKGRGDVAGSWIYYPWSGILMHCVDESDLLKLRTNRNRNLISTDEQEKLMKSIVGIAGMSVGAGIAKSLVYSGVSRTIKIADGDVLSTSNLNRLSEAVHCVGQSKVILAARSIFDIDPYANIHIFDHGLDKQNLEKFFAGPDLDVVVDEIDDFNMKLQLRFAAKAKKIPLVMFTSLGDNILVDVERYDTDDDLQPFNGAVGNVAEELLRKAEFSDADAKRYAVQLVGAEFVPTRALQSLTEIGSNLVGRPQLYSTVAVDAGLATYVIKRLILKGDIASGRYDIHFADFFNLEADDYSQTSERQAILEKLIPKSKSN